MSYTAPAGNAVAFQQTGIAYTAPAGNAVAAQWEAANAGAASIGIGVDVRPSGTASVPLSVVTAGTGAAGIPAGVVVAPAGAAQVPLSVTLNLAGKASVPVALSAGRAGFAAVPIRLDTGPSDSATVPVSVLVGASYKAHVLITVNVLPRSGAPALPISVKVGQTGAAALPIGLSVLPPELVSGRLSAAMGAWAVHVTLAGGSVTDMVVGEITVEAEEGSARIADFILLPDPGETLYLPGWVGKPVTIDFGARQPDGSILHPMRLFTGIVDLPSFNFTDRSVSVRCTDDLQGVLDGMSNADLGSLIGGYWSPAIFDPAAFGWTYAQDRISTVGASVDLDVNRQPRCTSWIAKDAADLVFDGDLIEDGSLTVELAQRSALTNTVDITFDYRYPRLKADGHRIDFTLVGLSGFAQFIEDQKSFLSRAAVAEAITKCGGVPVENIHFTPLPADPVEVGTGFWLPTASNAELCMGFSAVVAFSYGQTAEENHRITVSNPVSVESAGVVRQSMSGALEGKYPDVAQWETQTALYGAVGVKATPPQDTVPAQAGKTVSIMPTLTPDTDRAAANLAMETLIATAKTTIWKSHRENRVGLTVPLNPVVDLDKTIEVTHDGVQARGKCRAVRHRLNPESARAVSEISIAICALAGVGVTHPDSDVSAPAGMPLPINNLQGLPAVSFDPSPDSSHELTINFPGADPGERNNEVREIDSSFNAPIFENLFTVTI